jgi:hypothetical protein
VFCRENTHGGGAKMASNYRVLSVTRAIGILYFLKEPPQKHSLRTYNALDINKSAASAVLQPLQTSGVIVYVNRVRGAAWICHSLN